MISCCPITYRTYVLNISSTTCSAAVYHTPGITLAGNLIFVWGSSHRVLTDIIFVAIAARRLVVNSPTRSTVDHPFARQFVGVLVPPSSIARRPFARSLAHAVALAPLRSYTVGARSEETIKCRPGPKSYLVCPNQHHQLNLLGGDSFFFSAQIRPLSEFVVSCFLAYRESTSHIDLVEVSQNQRQPRLRYHFGGEIISSALQSTTMCRTLQARLKLKPQRAVPTTSYGENQTPLR